MDDRYRQPALPTPSGGPYQSIAPQSYNGSQSHLPTLPPITGNNSPYPSLYNHSHHSNPQTPITPHTPVSSAPGNPNIPPISQHPPLRPIQPSPSPYLLPNSSYTSSQASLLSTSSHPNPHQLAPVPLQNGLQDFRSGGLSMPPHSQLYPHAPMMSNADPEPVHVVGQQGRRGVLPTHPGRPPPAAGKAPANPNKNAEGKYDCPHCNKTYLHLKHLKRHLLRRKYLCGMPPKSVTNKMQTLASGPTSAIYARTLFRAATSSSDISRNARYDAAIRLAQAICRTLNLTSRRIDLPSVQRRIRT
jgi:hypothetical protein